MCPDASRHIYGVERDLVCRPSYPLRTPTASTGALTTRDTVVVTSPETPEEGHRGPPLSLTLDRPWFPGTSGVRLTSSHRWKELRS